MSKQFILKHLQKIFVRNKIFFTENGIYFCGYPMFVIPLNLFADFHEKLFNQLGKEKTEKTLFLLGKLQGWAIQNFFKRFNIIPNQKYLDFYVEQLSRLSLGRLEILDIKIVNQGGRGIIYSNIRDIFTNNKKNKNFTDKYLEGCIMGFSNYLFNSYKTDYKLSDFKNESYLLTGFENQKYSPDELEKYLLKKFNELNSNINLYNYGEKIQKKNITLFELLKRKQKNIFEIKSEGTFIFDELHFFTGFWVFIHFSEIFLQIDAKTSETLFNLGKKHCQFLIEKIGKNIEKNTDLYLQLFSLTGMGKINLMTKNTNNTKKFRISLLNPIYTKIYHIMYPESEFKDNNFYIEGFLTLLFSNLLKKNCKVTPIKQKNNFLNSVLFEIEVK